jgi:hypothetical protein
VDGSECCWTIHNLTCIYPKKKWAFMMASYVFPGKRESRVAGSNLLVSRLASLCHSKVSRSIVNNVKPSAPGSVLFPAEEDSERGSHTSAEFRESLVYILTVSLGLAAAVDSLDATG